MKIPNKIYVVSKVSDTIRVCWAFSLMNSINKSQKNWTWIKVMQMIINLGCMICIHMNMQTAQRHYKIAGQTSF